MLNYSAFQPIKNENKDKDNDDDYRELQLILQGRPDSRCAKCGLKLMRSGQYAPVDVGGKRYHRKCKT